MTKFFRLHDYLDNMKEKNDVFSFKAKGDIWWENVKNVNGIREEELTWTEFERLFRGNYLSKR